MCVVTDCFPGQVVLAFTLGMADVKTFLSFHAGHNLLFLCNLHKSLIGHKLSPSDAEDLA
jgi:hypothetical protein